MRREGIPALLPAGAALITLLTVAAAPPADAAPDPDPDRTGRQIYEATCAACHGVDGRGNPPTQVGFDVPLPDFADCNFASREPDGDWVGVAAEGGPTRAFDHTMPAFDEALSAEELQKAMEHIRTFCPDEDWPRGELNLPRAMYTEKAYPEDEAVWTVASPVDGPMGFHNEIVYEQRFGKRSQWELVVPFAAVERPAEAGGGWTGGFGDVAIGAKHALWHSLATGSILSIAGEVILPLGDEDDGIGGGVTILEPFVSFGQILPAEAFFQAQVGGEFPTDTDIAGNEAFWRGALGRTFTAGDYGRAWSPMVEVVGSRELESGATTRWDVVPQFQVSLNTRQHILANIALRIPLNDTEVRDTRLAVYFLWDWFDGGLTDGW
ncbi:MAG: c-type cytochrome [Gemmatimonadota bacterium]